VPLAVVSLIAIIFLPNKPLTRMTTSERVQASEADLATVSAPAAMETLAPAGADESVSDAASAADPAAEAGAETADKASRR
jgi:hypothetical protein